MGFNIGVSANPNDFKAAMECDKFIDRAFYNWVAEFEHFGDQSCIIQTGKYFTIDLKPLTNLIYTNDALDEDYIHSGLQKTDFLIELITGLINNVEAEPTYIEKIEYQYNKGTSDDERKMMIKVLGHDPFPKIENPTLNPWKNYVTDGDLLEHLIILKHSLECYQTTGHKKVFLTAG